MYGWLTGLTPLKGDRFSQTGTGDLLQAAALRYRYRASSPLLTLQHGIPSKPLKRSLSHFMMVFSVKLSQRSSRVILMGLEYSLSTTHPPQMVM